MSLKRLLVVAVFLLLVGCAPSPSPTPAATATVSKTLDTSPATPALGGVTVLSVPGSTSLALRAQPNVQAVVIARATPGDIHASLFMLVVACLLNAGLVVGLVLLEA